MLSLQSFSPASVSIPATRKASPNFAGTLSGFTVTNEASATLMDGVTKIEGSFGAPVPVYLTREEAVPQSPTLIPAHVLFSVIRQVLPPVTSGLRSNIKADLTYKTAPATISYSPFVHSRLTGKQAFPEAKLSIAPDKLEDLSRDDIEAIEDESDKVGKEIAVQLKRLNYSVKYTPDFAE